MATGNLGSRVRLRYLHPAELPSHPDLQALQRDATAIDPKTFAKDVLEEAQAFTLKYWPQHFEIKSGSKSSPPAKAPVELVVGDVKANEIPQDARVRGAAHDETWFGRVSIHDNLAEPGTGTWSEFEQVLLDNHSVNEGEYTPDIYHTHQVLAWNSLELEGVPGWTKVGMEIWEMCHDLPAPLNKRTFPVLVVKALSNTSSSPSFLTAQIPVDLRDLPTALYANGKNKTDGKTAAQKKDTVSGIYVSVERAELVDDGTKVKWQMATASDAKGNLPAWMQKLGVPGAVVKDVGLVIGYIEKRRHGKT